MALMTFAHFPEVNLIKAGLLFVLHNTFIDEMYKRDRVDELWGVFAPHLEQLKFAYENDMWMAKPGALCGWCPVESCSFYRER